MVFRLPAAATARSTPTPPESPDPPSAPGQEAVDLILGLGRVLLALGSPAHRLEASLGLIARRLGLAAELFCTPTALIVALEDDGRRQTHLVRVEPGSPNLGKLSDINEVLLQLEARDISLREACARADAIFHAPVRHGLLLSLLAFTFISTAAAAFLGGGWREVGLAAGLGTVTGIIGLGICRLRPDWTRVYIPLAATLVSLLAALFCAWDGRTNMLLPLIAGLLVLLPGLDFTAATRELATSHWVSGSSRLAGAMVVLTVLAFGMVLGTELGQAIAGPVTMVTPVPVPIWAVMAAYLLAATGFILLFEAYPRDWIWIVLVSLVAVLSLRAGQDLLGPVLGAALGGTLVGITGNLFVRLTRRPASILHTPGLILLVPGALGFRSLAAILSSDVVSGVESFFLALLTAVALATGMIIASVLLPPSREL